MFRTLRTTVYDGMRRLVGLSLVIALVGGVRVGPAAARGVVYEKATTLDESLRVAQRLRDAGIDVVLTRVDDRSVALASRTADAKGADLLVSIHNNASPSRS